MYETLKLMKTIIIGKEKDTKEEDLIREYQISKSPNILAFMYVDNFGMIKTISDYYSQIDSEDKASFCLQELDKALLSFDFQNQFMTYFCKCYKNRLRMEAKQLNTQKRKILFNTTPLNEELLEDFQDFSIEDENLILSNYNLTNDEKELCKYLGEGYKLSELAQKFNKSVMSISNTRQKIINKMLLEI